MTRFLIAHDLGTSGNKATLFSADGHLIRSYTESYPTHFYNSCWAEQNPADWWEAFCRSNQILLEGIPPQQVEAISFSGQMMGCVVVDRNGDPLENAIIWCDQRAQEQEQFLKSRLNPVDFYQITGHPISRSYSLEKLMWIRDHCPSIYQRIYKILLPKDFLISRLTGQFFTDYSDASGTNCFDLKRLTWAPQILQTARIPQGLLPDAVPSTYVAGTVSQEAAQRCGLLAGTKVVMGGGDGVCASVGAGSVCEDRAYNYLGSSSWISFASREPIWDSNIRTFNWVHMVPGYYVPTGTMQAAGNSYAFWQRMLFEGDGRSSSQRYQAIDHLITQSPPGARRLLYLPYLLGERSPRWNPHARGTLIGLTMEHSSGDIMRACVEGIAMNLALILKIFQAHTPLSNLTLLGGLANSPVICQILCNIFGLPVTPLVHLDEATSMGAAVAGGVGVGLLEDFSCIEQFIARKKPLFPQPLLGEFYQQLLRVFDNSYTALEKSYKELAML